MNFFISLRAVKPMFTTTVVNCGRTGVSSSFRQLWTKPCGNDLSLVNKCRLGGLASAPVKQITIIGRRTISKNAAPVPAYKSNDHSGAWVWERMVAVGLIVAIPVFVNVPSDIAEYVLATFVIVHLHRGLEAICTDYLRPCVVGNFIPKCIPVIVYVPLGVVFYGILNSIMNDRGIAHVLKQFWHLKTTEQLKSDQKPDA